MNADLGKGESCIYVHTTLVPIMGVVGEQKTKPTQHSVKELRSIGIQPDVIVCRAKEPLEDSIKRKISLFCDVPVEAVVSCPDASSIYEVPMILEEQGLTDFLLHRLKLEPKGFDMTEWKEFAHRILNPNKSIKVACVGKYTHLADSYISHFEAFHHAGAEAGTKVELIFVDSEVVQEFGITEELQKADAILIPGGFGNRGIEGKIMCSQVRPGEQGSVSWRLSRVPDRHVGDRQGPYRNDRCELHRVRQGQRLSGSGPAPRAEERHEEGGHHETGGPTQ